MNDDLQILTPEFLNSIRISCLQITRLNWILEHHNTNQAEGLCNGHEVKIMTEKFGRNVVTFQQCQCHPHNHINLSDSTKESSQLLYDICCEN